MYAVELKSGIASGLIIDHGVPNLARAGIHDKCVLFFVGQCCGRYSTSVMRTWCHQSSEFKFCIGTRT